MTAAGLAKSQLGHQSADVVIVITNAELGFDSNSQPHGCPAIIRKSKAPRAFGKDKGNLTELFGVQARRPTGCPAFFQALRALVGQRAVPPGGGGPAHTIFSGNLRLREPPGQILGSLKPAPFHFVA